jgi:hypothetical protein
MKIYIINILETFYIYFLIAVFITAAFAYTGKKKKSKAVPV